MPSLAVGRTPLQKSIEYCGRASGAQVWVKREDKNPRGTFKDRRCAALLEQNRGNGEVVYVHITGGNSGYSLGMMAQEEERQTGQKIHVVNVVPKGISPEIKKRLQNCSFVHEMDLSNGIAPQDELRAVARRLTGFSGSEDHILPVENYGLVNGYGRIITEIQEAGVKPTYIFCPVGEGELLVELAHKAKAVWGTEAPMIIGVTVKQNAIIQAVDFIKKLGRSVADKLVNGYSKFKPLVEGLVAESRAEVMVVSEREIEQEYRYANSIGIACEPSAAAAFVGVGKYRLLPQDVVVVVNTGKGVYDQTAADRVWSRRMKRAGKHAIAVAVTAIVTTLGAGEWQKYREKEHRLFRQRIGDIVMIYADKDHDRWIDREEAMRICSVIPGRTCTHPIVDLIYGLESFSDRELVYYASWARWEAHSDAFGRRMQNRIYSEYVENRFDVYGWAEELLRY